MNLLNLKVSLRNARKNGVISFAKIFGLTIAFVTILFAVSYVYYEKSFDKHVTDNDKIYRCLMQGFLNNEKADYAVTSGAEGPSLESEVPEIADFLRLHYQGDATLTSNKKDYLKGKLYYSDSNFFSFWDISLKSDIKEPLAGLNSLIISESMAKKLFSSTSDALGENVILNDDECVVTGVFNDLPNNFHLQIDFLQSIKKSIPDAPVWYNQNLYTYIKTVKANINNEYLNFKISKNVYTHFGDIDGATAQTMDDMKLADNFYLFYTAEPLSDIHFSQHKFDPAKTANKTYVFGAIVLAILVLLISSINFVNLSVANLSTRYKEIGIRKTIGAIKEHILTQFINEILIFFFIALSFALVLFFSFAGTVSHFFGFDIRLNPHELLKIISYSTFFLLLFLLSINAIPIWLTSKHSTLNLIKGKHSNQKQQIGNNVFLLIQFVLSVAIILSSVIMNKQVNYIVSKDKGYKSENIMKIDLWGLPEQQRQSFIEQLRKYPVIQSVSSTENYLGHDLGMNDAYFEDRSNEENYFHPSILPIDDQFARTFDIKIKEGRLFDKTRKNDYNVVVLNSAAAKAYTGEGSLIGKKIIFNNSELEVIGIVDDFNFRSLHHPIEPLLLTFNENQGNVYMKIRMENSSEAIRIVQDLWNEYNINTPFGYEYLDDVLALNYQKDQQAKKLLLSLSILSIIIACVGLYAMSFFSIVKKTKEIGVRKVNGATNTEIITLLNINFIKWVLIAFIIAIPVAYYTMQKWLENFAYKTPLSWWVFALAGVLALGIALLTVSWQSWRAATRNPVEALRYE